MSHAENTWNPGRYRGEASFVIDGGRSLVEELAPTPGERVLDLGSGTGELTRSIAESGARVLGVDASEAMVEAARRAHPELHFEIVRGEALAYDGEFDAIFSNAALHWMPRAGDVAAGMFRALVPGGRLVAEFGGAGNVAEVRRAVDVALAELRPALASSWCPWYFPRLGAYTGLLETAGFWVFSARSFARPSPMPDSQERSGLSGWLELFASELLQALVPEERRRFFEIVEREARAKLFREGVWWIDYVRLRVAAARPGGFTA